MEVHPDLGGIVLVGGRSSRFGSDKAAASLAGRPMLEWVVEAVAAACASVVIVRAARTPPPPVAPRVHVTHAEDAVAGKGPLAGLIAGLAATTESQCFAVSCDAPLLRPALVALLYGLIGGHDVACPRVAGRLQPLAAIYRTSASLPVLRDALERGERSLTRAIGGLSVRVIEEQELRRADPQLDTFRTANTPGELEVLARYALARQH